MSKKENEGWTKVCFRDIKREYRKISDSRAREIMTFTAWLLGKTHLDFHVWAQSRFSLSLSGPRGVLYEFSNINVFNMPDILENVLWSFCILVGLLFAYTFSRLFWNGWNWDCWNLLICAHEKCRICFSLFLKERRSEKGIFTKVFSKVTSKFC